MLKNIFKKHRGGDVKDLLYCTCLEVFAQEAVKKHGSLDESLRASVIEQATLLTKKALQGYKTLGKGEAPERSKLARREDSPVGMPPELCFTTHYGETIEFKAYNETNSRSGSNGLFTWREAMNYYIMPNVNGWRLPTSTELYALIRQYPVNKTGDSYVFDGRFVFPIEGYCEMDEDDGSPCDLLEGLGGYWSSSENDGNRSTAWFLDCGTDRVEMSFGDKENLCLSVRLVRTVKRKN